MTKRPSSEFFLWNQEPTPTQVPARPAFGFLLGGTTFGLFFGCVLICAGAGPLEIILILLAIFGAITGGILEALWPKRMPIPIPKPAPTKTITPSVSTRHECQSCGEVFSPEPVTCPMCGHKEDSHP